MSAFSKDGRWHKTLPGGLSAHQIIEKNPNKSSKELGKILHSKGFIVGDRGLRRYRQILKITPVEVEANETQSISETEWTAELRGTRIKSLDEMLEYMKVDLSEWKVERYVINKWEVGRRDKNVNLTIDKGVMFGSVNDTGKVFVEPLFQVKVWLVRKKEVVAAKNEIELLRELAKTVNDHPPKITLPKSKNSGHVLELSIPDIHLGRLSRGDETGWANYDLEIAKRIFSESVSSLLAQVSHFNFDEVIFVVGNDILNADNLLGTTTAGTPQNNDSRYHKVFQTARTLMVETIEILRRISKVKVIVVSGNHDTLGAWHLGDSLDAYFHHYKDVTVENNPTSRKYYEYGKVMLMWTHGDEEKLAAMPLTIASEQPEMWGRTRYREIHCGHFHKAHLEEHKGIRVRILPSLVAPDNWTSRKGYIGGIRSAEAYVWNKDRGLVATATYVVPIEDEKQ